MDSTDRSKAHFSQTAAYFDSIAAVWDSLQDIPTLAETLKKGLVGFGIAPDERILDIGCGTGNCTAALLQLLSDQGRIEAVDVSSAIIGQAKAKIRDPRVSWYSASVCDLPFEDFSADRAICYSVWPHIRESVGAIRELARVLRPGGKIHIWHTRSRLSVNAIHSRISGPVGRDRLAPAGDVTALLEANGFSVTEEIDDERQYLISGIKTG
jgi:ubiquinone/menaquinone biosynthesis C-methylase UbiE